ncbi:uncharacterized protein B0H18DRAFT_987531 [Fomitopsis serialis]|uniref:uncharacterized protein n=1 Tax=Fomitopsis serialis TaxID=139415 RepID=UPI002007B029|nr:uncharacterized protein B0H18DRAFT_987531 [Neoantrodia serialis]KAH9932311.1 hypothetical protein B0H18DRAFT_987531 [Neoantrodia serialis]
MLVDNPLQSGFSLNSSFEDFFNMDLLAGPSHAAGSSSSGSSPRSDGSPSDSFSGLPPTPPNPYMPDVALNSNPYLDFPLDDDFSKLDLPMPLAAPGFDFMGAFTSAAAQMASPSDSGSGASSSTSGTSPTSIDPQLVTSPTGPRPVSEFGEGDEGDDDEDGDLDDTASAMNDALDDELSLAPMKVGVGRSVKRAGSEKKENKPANMLSTTSADPEDWRPTPEEYKKMNSKEKRQLRNKISARNFVVHTTLEGDIAERDRLIDAIRTELGSMLLLDGRGRVDAPVLPPPAPIPPLPSFLPALFQWHPGSAPPKSPLVTPNTQKDLPTSPRLGARGFWGGASSPFGAGGFTPVHTTLVPEWGSVLRSPTLQENINPVLNAAPWPSADKAQQQQQQQQLATSQQATGPAIARKPKPACEPQLLALRPRERPPPHYFAKSGPLSAILSGKAAVNAYPTPPNSPPLAPSHAHNLQPSNSGSKAQQPTAQQAMLASMASQTLMGKLGSAFWDAFARSPRVRRVMEGSAVLKVVDVEPQEKTSPRVPAPQPMLARTKKCQLTDVLAESMASLSLGRSRWSS